MKYLIIIQLQIAVLFGANSWVGFHSDVPTKTEVEVVSSNIDETVLEFSINGFHLRSIEFEKGEMVIPQLEDGASLLIESSPDMHSYSKSIIIPDNQRMGVEILDARYEEFENISMAPSKGNINRLVNPSELPFVFGEVYENDSFFPGEIVDLKTPYILRDLRGQTVSFQPFQYNPITHVLRVYKYMKVKIEKMGDDDRNIVESQMDRQFVANEFEHMYKSHFLNFSNDTRFDYLVDHGNMLIVSYSSFLETMQPLVDWKLKKGIPTELIDVADIGGTSGAIEAFVEDYYNTHGLTFLLLVGDIAQIPSPSVGGSASDVSYGCISGNDYYPEIIVGRFSGSIPSHIETQVSRSIEYERNPTDALEWYDNALGIASNQGPGLNGFSDDEFNDFLWETVLSGFTYDSYQGIYDPSGTLTQGINAINAGVSIINYTGHGSINSWGNGAPLSNSNVNSLTNSHLLPFVITVGCNVGEFQSTNECFTETWLRATHNGAPSGAISHFGSTISQSWEPPMHGQYGMNLILTESYDEHLTRTMGGITTNGCMYMNDVQGASGINETKYWTFFGDPSVPLRTAPPTSISASFDDVIILGTPSFSVNTGNEGDLIAISRNGELLSSGYSDSNGLASLDLSNVSSIPGEVDLVITGFNSYPFETTLMVLSPDGPFVMVESFEVNTAINSSIIEYGEDVSLGLYLENVGNDNAENVEVVMSTLDEYITITSNQASISIIDANSTGFVEGLEFQVSYNIPNDYSFSIDCIITDGNETWESELNLTAYAPTIEIESVDGMLNPGESSGVTVILQNVGGAVINYPMVSASDDGSFEITVESFTNAYYWDNNPNFNSEVLELEIFVNPTTPIGHIAEFELFINQLNTEYESMVYFTIPVGQVTETFEAGFEMLDWNMSGNADWIIDDSESNSGMLSAKSGAIGNSQNSDLSVTLEITESGVIEFNYKVSAEYSSSGSYFYDGLEFYIDSNLQDQHQSTTTGGAPWTEVSYPVTAGEHTFTWSFVKDGGGGSTDCDNTDCEDAAWIDDIVFPPAYVDDPPEIVLGDVNFDNSIDILDIVMMVNMILGTEISNTAGDVNEDGEINIMDVILTINIILES